MRLQKYMAACGVASRRACEEYIQQGLVEVNGKIVHELGTKINPDHDEIVFQGKRLLMQKKYTIALYKPEGYICSNSDPEGRKTVQELIQDVPARLVHVGRLDYNTQGLLLMTNDGELANALMHPSKEINKSYSILCKGKIAQDALKVLREGVMLEDGITAPAEVSFIRFEGDRSRLRMTIHEGRNRQVRRMMHAVGHEVYALKRDRVGGVDLKGLLPGQWRYLGVDEVNNLKRLAKR